jgi:hypothetical protein
MFHRKQVWWRIAPVCVTYGTVHTSCKVLRNGWGYSMFPDICKLRTSQIHSFKRGWFETAKVSNYMCEPHITCASHSYLQYLYLGICTSLVGFKGAMASVYSSIRLFESVKLFIKSSKHVLSPKKQESIAHSELEYSVYRSNIELQYLGNLRIDKSCIH